MERLNQLAINDEGFIFDPITGNSFTTNSVGLYILKLLKEGKNDDEIVNLLTERYEIDTDRAKRDITDFLEQLRTYKLI